MDKTFETKRLILRPWRETDAESLFEYAKDPLVGPITGFPVHTSVENSLDIIRNCLSNDETYAVCLKEDNRAIGSVGLMKATQSHISIDANEMEIGYWLGVPFWGQGLIPEAVNRLLEYAFNELGCTAMWCGYYDNNHKSRRVTEKCGFKYDHSEENSFVPALNEYRTLHLSKLTKEEWLNRKL